MLKRTAVFLGLALIALLAAGMGCSFTNALTKTATPTATTPAPTATSTQTPLPPTASNTPLPSPTDQATATPDGGPGGATTTSAVPPIAGITYPLKFNIVLSAPATSCGEALSSEFTVTLTETTISMYQIELQLTSTGPYNPATGAFTSTVSGLPGTETYTGKVTFTPGAGGTIVSMNGQFTYTGDPEWTCNVPDLFSGQTTINP